MVVVPCYDVRAPVCARQRLANDERPSICCAEVIRAEIGLQHKMISVSDGAAASATTPALPRQWIDTSAELLSGCGSVCHPDMRKHDLPSVERHELSGRSRASNSATCTRIRYVFVEYTEGVSRYACRLCFSYWSLHGALGSSVDSYFPASTLEIQTHVTIHTERIQRSAPL